MKTTQTVIILFPHTHYALLNAIIDAQGNGTSKGTLIETKEQLDDWLIGQASYDRIKTLEEALTEMEAWDWYNKALPGLNIKAPIVIKPIGQNDKSFLSFIKALAKYDWTLVFLTWDAN